MTGWPRCQCYTSAHYPRYIKLLIYYTPTIITPLCRMSQKVFWSNLSNLRWASFRCFCDKRKKCSCSIMFHLLKKLDSYLSFCIFYSPDRPLENVGARVLDTNSTFFWFEHLLGGWPGCRGHTSHGLCNQCVNTPPATTVSQAPAPSPLHRLGKTN